MNSWPRIPSSDRPMKGSSGASGAVWAVWPARVTPGRASVRPAARPISISPPGWGTRCTSVSATPRAFARPVLRMFPSKPLSRRNQADRESLTRTLTKTRPKSSSKGIFSACPPASNRTAGAGAGPAGGVPPDRAGRRRGTNTARHKEKRKQPVFHARMPSLPDPLPPTNRMYHNPLPAGRHPGDRGVLRLLRPHPDWISAETGYHGICTADRPTPSGRPPRRREMKAILRLMAVTTLFLTFLPAQAVSGDEILNSIRILADDSMEGRGTGSRGERKAADYVVDQFRKAGLQPAAGRSFIQKVPLIGVTANPSMPLVFEGPSGRFQVAYYEDFMGCSGVARNGWISTTRLSSSDMGSPPRRRAGTISRAWTSGARCSWRWSTIPPPTTRVLRRPGHDLLRPLELQVRRGRPPGRRRRAPDPHDRQGRLRVAGGPEVLDRASSSSSGSGRSGCRSGAGSAATSRRNCSPPWVRACPTWWRPPGNPTSGRSPCPSGW